MPETNFTGFKTMNYSERKYINNNKIDNTSNSGLDIENSNYLFSYINMEITVRLLIRIIIFKDSK